MILISVFMMEVAAISSATKGAQFTGRPVLCLARDCYIIGLTLLDQYGCLLIAIEQDIYIYIYIAVSSSSVQQQQQQQQQQQ